jgi:hypothetical protein
VFTKQSVAALDIEPSRKSVTAAAQATCAAVFAGRIAVTGHRERSVGRLVIRLCVTAAVCSFRTRSNSPVNRFDLIGAAWSCMTVFLGTTRLSDATLRARWTP